MHFFSLYFGHLLMTEILGPTILLPNAYKFPMPPKPVALVFILLFVFLKSFLEFKVLAIKLGCLLGIIVLLGGTLVTDEYLFVGCIFFLSFSKVRAVCIF